MEFKDQYKHPLWQKKRLEALEAALFTCNRCYDNETQLHVHHKRYVSGRKIWEYEVSELEVLCDECHAIAHDDKERFQQIQGRICSEGLCEITHVLTGYLENIQGPARSGFNDQQAAINYGDPNSFDVLIGRLAAVASNNLGLFCLENLIAAIETLERGERRHFVLSRPDGFCPEDGVPF